MSILSEYNRRRSANGPLAISDDGLRVSTDAIIFDFDDTLAFMGDLVEEHLWGGGDLDTFHAATMQAPANQWVLDKAIEASRNAVAVLVMTARREKYADVTIEWLEAHDVPVDRLYMRRDDDHRPHDVSKRDMLATIAADGFNVIHVYEDAPHNIAMFRDMGLPVTEVYNPQWLDPRATTK